MTADPLSELPDYPALRQIQDALWGAGEIRGAAIMVGAGLSRAALRAAEDTQAPPLWSDFVEAMAGRLRDLDPGRDPLKLADEYEAALGRHALDSLIRDLVRDSHWRPGPLHERILGLPWADVLTTNWDTLLERTLPKDPDRTYEVVRVPADIARTRSPRIVKLHGSMPSHMPFIFTGEDFRTYPQRFAPFVNLAQQVLLENELCLIGFSGDDPNFLQWSGWVRDQLGSSARRIRLVGALNLTPSRRKVLEQHNVSPIDLAEAVKDRPEGERHLAALELFVESLWAARPRAPHVWEREALDEEEVRRLAQDEPLVRLTEIWRKDRAAFPGWAVAPSHERRSLRYETDQAYRMLRAAFETTADAGVKANVLAELAWRYDTAFWPIDDWLFDHIGAVLADENVKLAPNMRQVLLLARCRAARARRRADVLEEALVALEATQLEPGPAAFERALWARDQMDLAGVAEQTQNVRGDDPLWTLRRASLLAIQHRTQEAAAEIQAAFLDIHARRALDPRSVWLLSREAWAGFLMRMARSELRKGGEPVSDDEVFEARRWRYREAECEPWDEFHAFDQDLDNLLRTQARRESPSSSRFDPGVYRTFKTEPMFVSHVASPPLEDLLALAERVGLPDRLGNWDVISGRLQRALEAIVSRDESHVWRTATFLRDYDRGPMEQVFGRVSIAAMPQSLVNELLRAVRSAIDHAEVQLRGDERADWVSRLRVLLELASRLAVRCDAETAKDLFGRGSQIAANPDLQHWWAFKSLEHLLVRSYSAVPPDQRHELGLAALMIPLPGERSVRGLERDWPEVAAKMAPGDFARPLDSAEWTLRVAELLRRVLSRDELTRSRAIWCLLKLNEANALTPSEKISLGDAIWGQTDAEGLPENTGIYAFALLMLPEAEPGQALAAFRAAILEPLVKGHITEPRLHSLAEAVDRGLCGLEPSEAAAILGALLKWCPPQGRGDPWGQGLTESQGIAEAIGACLAHAVLPALPAGFLDDAALTRLAESIVSDEASPKLQAAAQLCRLAPCHSASVVAALRRAIASGDDRTLRHAAEGVRGFLRPSALAASPPRVLVADIVGSCAIRRDVGVNWLLYTVLKLEEAGCLEVEERQQLIRALEFLLAETSYQTWNPSDPRTSSLTLIRRDCLRLALSLRGSGEPHPVLDAWLAAGPIDPMPEVRFATFDSAA